MKKTLAVVLVMMSFSAMAQVDVSGYYKQNGTYVQPHHRTAPNNTISDNYSTQGNVNPYTGQPGTVPNTGYDNSAALRQQAQYQQQMLQLQEQQRQMQQLQQQQLQQQAQQRNNALPAGCNPQYPALCIKSGF